MGKKNIRGINELIDHMRREDKIYLNVNREFYSLSKSQILNTPFGTLLRMLDDCEVFIDADVDSLIKTP
jgi:hypothetical protein